MRTIMAMTAAALTLAACDKAPGARPLSAGRASAGSASIASVRPPTRRAGLWRQTMTRDGVEPPMVGTMRICLDAASDARLSVFGGKIGKAPCARRSVGRRADGAYVFISTCDVGGAGVTNSTGTLSGDFVSRYHVHVASLTTGSSIPSMNGRHVIDIDATWLGACPAGIDGGDVIMANGMKVDMMRLGAVAGAMSGGG
ncbi:MAG: DUF3617 family protein [Caulobacteraceae bacterium]